MTCSVSQLISFRDRIWTQVFLTTRLALEMLYQSWGIGEEPVTLSGLFMNISLLGPSCISFPGLLLMRPPSLVLVCLCSFASLHTVNPLQLSWFTQKDTETVSQVTHDFRLVWFLGENPSCRLLWTGGEPLRKTENLTRDLSESWFTYLWVSPRPTYPWISESEKKIPALR